MIEDIRSRETLAVGEGLSGSLVECLCPCLCACHCYCSCDCSEPSWSESTYAWRYNELEFQRDQGVGGSLADVNYREIRGVS